ncbi:hypothetical protein BU25DRAFT_189403 [Macroventuria anomochaeta]|uniref:Uncharacterized protein n=1 Tax=Macroventuria anomochaeta TaxID=301207 RepID=A0ACB6SDR8_9PLEO|nr:uncharacterized protein BU25DRAFT_189403 [Macroventuria anomochaeta]KAF2631478.1 hypothetical protein BU25DRAFT_189403 [Macroventuria anomochaeta]
MGHRHSRFTTPKQFFVAIRLLTATANHRRNVSNHHSTTVVPHQQHVFRRRKLFRRGDARWQDRILGKGLAQRSPAPSPPATKNRRAKSHASNGHVNLVQRLIGLHQWENNEQLSDVVVRFGDHPEDVFHGHKAILSSWSFWFRNDFMSPAWRKANSKEIILHGDKPTYPYLLLRALYVPGNKFHISEPWLDREAANAAEMTLTKRALFSISV